MVGLSCPFKTASCNQFPITKHTPALWFRGSAWKKAGNKKEQTNRKTMQLGEIRGPAWLSWFTRISAAQGASANVPHVSQPIPRAPEGGVISVQCRRSACLFWAEAPWGQAGPDSTCEYPKILPKTDGGRHVPDSLSTNDRTWTTQSQYLGHIVRCSNSNCCYVVHSLNSKAFLPQTLQ